MLKCALMQFEVTSMVDEATSTSSGLQTPTPTTAHHNQLEVPLPYPRWRDLVQSRLQRKGTLSPKSRMQEGRNPIKWQTMPM